jgi:hypothetical protein
MTLLVRRQRIVDRRVDLQHRRVARPLQRVLDPSNLTRHAEVNPRRTSVDFSSTSMVAALTSTNGLVSASSTMILVWSVHSASIWDLT